MTWSHQITVAGDAVNLTPATGAIAIFSLKQAAKVAGHTVPSSGDASTYNSSGDQITTGASGAGGMANVRAWFRLYDATTGHEWCFQRTSGNQSWRIKFSASARFVGGSPNANTVPSATDEQVLCGSGTDASPTGATVLPTDNTYRFHCGFEGVDGRDWYGIAIPTGGGTCCRISSFSLQESSYPDAENNTTLVAVTSANAANNWSTLTVTQCIGSAYYNNTTTFVPYRGTVLARGSTGAAAFVLPSVSSVGANPFTGDEDVFPIWCFRDNNAADTSPGLKGQLRTSTVCMRSTLHTDGDYVTDTETGYRYIQCDDLLVRFPETVTPGGGSGFDCRVWGAAAPPVDPPDEDPPTITGISPSPSVAPGQPGGFSLNAAVANETPVAFTVGDSAPGLRVVIVTCKLIDSAGRSAGTFVVHDGTTFLDPFRRRSTRVVDGNDLEFSVLHDDGWVGAASFTFGVHAVDQAGNLEGA